MSMAEILSGLYPPAIRERWGEDISREVSTAGVRAWPNTLVGAVRLWLHPSDWPETATGQTRRVLTVALFAVTATTALVLRANASSATLTADLHRPLASAWLALLLLAVVLAAPLPVPRVHLLRGLVAVAVRALAAPVVALAALLLLAWSGVPDRATGLGDVVLAGYYWLTLGFVAQRLCLLVARVAAMVTLPTTRRLTAALVCLGAGLGLAASQSLVSLVRAGNDPGRIAPMVAFVVLATVAGVTAQDLRTAPR